MDDGLGGVEPEYRGKCYLMGGVEILPLLSLEAKSGWVQKRCLQEETEKVIQSL